MAKRIGLSSDVTNATKQEFLEYLPPHFPTRCCRCDLLSAWQFQANLADSSREGSSCTDRGHSAMRTVSLDVLLPSNYADRLQSNGRRSFCFVCLRVSCRYGGLCALPSVHASPEAFCARFGLQRRLDSIPVGRRLHGIGHEPVCAAPAPATAGPAQCMSTRPQDISSGSGRGSWATAAHSLSGRCWASTASHTRFPPLR